MALCRVPSGGGMPVQHAMPARAGGVETLGGKCHPVDAVGHRHERQDVASVIQAMPTQGAVVIGGDHHAAVAGHVDRHGCAGCGVLPPQRALLIKRPQVEFGPKHEAASIRANREAARKIGTWWRQRPASQGWGGRLQPAFNRQAQVAGRRGQVVGL